MDKPFSRRNCCCIRTVSRTCTAADKCRYTTIQGGFYLRRTDKVDMGIYTTSGKNITRTTVYLGGWSDNHTRCHTVLNVRITCFTDSHDFTVFDTDIRFYNTPVIDDNHIIYTKV